MRLATKEQHIDILTNHESDTEASNAYLHLTGKSIGRTTIAYWRKIFIDNAGKLATTDNQLKQGRKLRVPQPDDDVGTIPDLNKMYHCILHIPDQHAPYHHKDMIPFLAAVQKAFPIDLVVNAGDELDMHAMSFHDSDPNLDSAGTELEKAKPIMRALWRLFPVQLICHSNHGSMMFRKAKAHGIPVQMLRTYRDVIFGDPKAALGWSWAENWRVRTPLGDVMFTHQSANPTSDAAHNRCNLLVGHSHGRFEVQYCASPDYLYWGATGGCLIDKDSYAFAYGKHTVKKPIIGCTIILEGRPMLIPMILNRQGRWTGQL